MKKILFLLSIIFNACVAQADGDYGMFTDDQICKAGIAVNNGRSPQGIKFLDKQNKNISVAYTRDDGKIFGYSCKIEGDEIFWKDQTMSKWNKNIKLYYALKDNGKLVEIKSVIFGDAIEKTFSKTDF